MKNWKKYCSLLLTAAVCLSLLSAGAFALEEEEASETPAPEETAETESAAPEAEALIEEEPAPETEAAAEDVLEVPGEAEQTVSEEAANADESGESGGTVLSGDFDGDNDITWKLENGTLTLSGTGTTSSRRRAEDTPWRDYNSEITALVVEDGITDLILDFSGCANLAEVSIGRDVTGFSQELFAGTPWLENQRQGDFLIVNDTFLMEYLGEGGNVVIPDGVTRINYSAFQDCAGLTGVTIPDGVISIGKSAFEGCAALKSATIPDSVATIGQSAFKDCTSLASVKLGGGITEIGYETFMSCKSLTSVVIPLNVTSLGWRAFGSCESLADVTFENIETFTGYSAFGDMHPAFAGTPWLENLERTDDCLIINNHLIAYEGERGDVVIPDGVTSIEADAFCNCENLTGVSIPDSVTTIGYQAFYGCGNLTSITIPASVRSFGWSVFRFCYALTSVTFLGDAPELDENYGIFDDYITATAYYYGDTDGWTDEARAAFGGNITWEDMGSKYLRSADESVSAARADGGAWESGVTLAVTPAESAVISDGIKAKYGIEAYTAYDISLMKDGAAVQPDGNVIVTLPVPEGYDGSRCVVFRVEDGGALTALETRFENGILRFVTEHFSTYIVAEATVPSGSDKTDDVLLGDVNADGTVNAKDVTVLFQYVNKQKDTMPNMNAGDVNADGTVNAKDVTRLFQYANKQIESLSQ